MRVGIFVVIRGNKSIRNQLGWKKKMGLEIGTWPQNSLETCREQLMGLKGQGAGRQSGSG